MTARDTLTRTPISQTFVMNELISHENETLPLNEGYLAGYTGHVPGCPDVVGQRKAAATLHAKQLAPQLIATRGAYGDLKLVDSRPEQRTRNKTYMYAENCDTFFMKFANGKNADHRKL